MIGVLAAWMLIVAGQDGRVPGVVAIPAAAETAPMPSGDDAADDAAIWVHPDDPARSRVLGTDKRGGLAVYDLSGALVQYIACGRMNNVDLRTDVRWGATTKRVVAAASDRDREAIQLFDLEPGTERFRLMEDGSIPVGTTEIYGLCMMVEGDSGDPYVIVNTKAGVVQIHAVGGAADGAGAPVRRFEVGGQVEGMVVDESRGILYVGEENAGIWAYDLRDPEEHRRLVDAVGPVGRLTADVEGLTIAWTGGGEGYLIASCQGADRFAVYDVLPPNAYVGSFRIVGSGGVDGVTHTDGIDVHVGEAGPRFPRGVFVAQDDENDGEHQNFKLVDWGLIEDAMGLGEASPD